MSFCAAFIGVSGVIPMFLCRETTVFTLVSDIGKAGNALLSPNGIGDVMYLLSVNLLFFIQDEIQARDKSEDWTIIFGTIYDVEEYASIHPGGPSAIGDYIGLDASKVFPRRPPAELPMRCLNIEKEVKSGVVCESFDEVDELVNLQCHTNVVGFSGVDEYMGGYERGVLAHRLPNLKNDVHTQWIMIYNRIYNVTNYIDAFKDSETGEIDEDSEYAFLHDDLNKMIVNTLGKDATSVYEALYSDDVALSCLDDLFYMGVLDESPNM
jgi:chitin synthase